MSACPGCGRESPPDAKFCAECGRPLAGATPAGRQERKVVTVVFADLVGFTSRAERMDPEDVRALLSGYYARLRSVLERFGGTVEKFIGDAVMALFGAPVAHEDDPERAVRAALAIRDWMLERRDDLQVRIAVNTGEALVTLGARPGEGEGMASGDVVNTTARLQAAAPANGILVGERTYRATSSVIDYRDAEPVTARGKAEPLRVWEAVEARARFGRDLSPRGGAPFVGRAQELGVLTDALARVRRDRSAQLVTVIGVPGMGKSRLVGELFRVVDDDPGELMLWRQGRCLPYGADGVTFWALGEVVKAQAGILETDGAEAAENKLELAVSAAIADPAEAQWVVGHLRPLTGLERGTDLGSDRRSEAFTAWRHFLEALAEQRPLILVVEDLQWADDNLLDFVEHLVDWASGVRLLVVCTARPELLERRTGWGGGKRNAATLSLSPLSDEETARLIAGLTGQPVLAAETQEALLARAGGNPLYTEQFVRMMGERRRESERGGEREGEPALPETVQGIIAARLDALPVEEKSLLQTAAVVGKVFWLGALTAIGVVDSTAAQSGLHRLERMEFIQRARRSSVVGEVEYAFAHGLVRDVAYNQIPRAQRAERHRLAAQWLLSLGRAGDLAEMIAHHHLSALELRRAAGQPVDAALAAGALASLREAGDRALALNASASAARFYESALTLAAPASMARAELLLQLGRARVHDGDAALELLPAAIDELLARGAPEPAAEAEATLGEACWVRGDRDRAFEHLDRARTLVEGLAPSGAKASVISNVSRFLMLAGESAESVRLGREALAMAELLGLDAVRASALNNVGVSRIHLGDPGGITELEQSVALAVAVNSAEEICRARGNLATVLWEQGDLERAVALWAEAADAAERFGRVGFARWFRGLAPKIRYSMGRWDDALAAADAFLVEVERGSPHYVAPESYGVRAEIRMGRDDARAALADAERALELARPAKDPQILHQMAARCSFVFAEAHMMERASALADEFLEELRSTRSLGFAMTEVHTVAWTLSALGRGEELLPLLPASDSVWVRAARHFAAGELDRAAEVCAAGGLVTDEARVRLWLAESLVARGRLAEAEGHLRRALAFHRSVDARRYVGQGEALLAASA